MKLWRKSAPKNEAVSTTRLLLGAAGLLLFVVGIRRTYRSDAAGGTVVGGEEPAESEPSRAASPAGENVDAGDRETAAE